MREFWGWVLADMGHIWQCSSVVVNFGLRWSCTETRLCSECDVKNLFGKMMCDYSFENRLWTTCLLILY